MFKVLVSACLLGEPVRYHGGHAKSEHPVLERWLERQRVVAACPEVLGGLATPRPAAEIQGDRVVTRDGDDVTSAFQTGASIVATRVQQENIRVAVLKNGSPSCGSSFLYDGTFSGSTVEGAGITAARLRELGIQVFSEEQWEEAEQVLFELEAAELRARLAEVNELTLWDFEVSRLDDDTLSIVGGNLLTYAHEMELRFRNVVFTDLPERFSHAEFRVGRDSTVEEWTFWTNCESMHELGMKDHEIRAWDMDVRIGRVYYYDRKDLEPGESIAPWVKRT